MTDQLSAPAPSEQQNAKAAAKAAKAYAKASRRWYQKKRWILSIAAVALIAIGSTMGGGGTKSQLKATTSDNAGSAQGQKAGTADKATTKKKGAAAKGAVGSSHNPAPLGTAVQNKSAKYKILDVRTAKTVGPAGLQEKAAGTFVIVDLSVTNVKKESIQFSTNDVVLQVNGTEIEPDSAGFMLDGAFSFDDISPGLTKTGKVVFDVAPGDAGKGVIKAQALFSFDEPVYLKVK